MNKLKVVDGVYESRSHRGAVEWPECRRVYIQKGSVRLVNYKSVVAPEDNTVHVFSFQNFFDVNTLGPRVADLPENFDIRK